MLGVGKKKPVEPLQTWQMYLMLGVLLVAVLLGIVQKIRGVEPLQTTSDVELACAFSGGTWDKEHNLCLNNR